MIDASGAGRWRWLAPLAIAAVAVTLRLWSLSSGLPGINDPDELTFQLGAIKMLTTASLNPGWFGHPALTTMYGLALSNVLVFVVGYLGGMFEGTQQFIAAAYDNPTLLMLPGRVLMVLCSLGAVLCAGLFAARQWGRAAGLASAGLVAVSPVFVAWSQVIRSDIVACFMMLLALLSAQRIAAGSTRRRDIALCALWTALAIASKWPFAMTALAGAGALWFADGATARPLRDRLAHMLGYGALTLAFLAVLFPYLVIDFGTVIRHVAGEAQVRHLGVPGGTPWWNARWYVSGPILTALGFAGFALSLLGLGLMAKDNRAAAVITPPLFGFSILLVVQHLVWERWALPVFVLSALLAGAGAQRLVSSVAGQHNRRSAAIALVVGALLIQPAWQTALQNRARNNDTRQQASAWARAHFQPGSRVLVEHFAFEVLHEPWTFFFPLGHVGCVNANDWMRGKVRYDQVEAGRGNRANVDYGTLDPARTNTCQVDYAILTQYDRYLAERSDYPQEVANYEGLIARGRIVATFRPEPGVSSGPIVRIVAIPVS